jgi:hypothetical protein
MTLKRASELKPGDQVRLIPSARTIFQGLRDWNIIVRQDVDDGDLFVQMSTACYYFVPREDDSDSPIWEVFAPDASCRGGLWITHAWHQEVLERLTLIERAGALDNERVCYLLGWQKVFKLSYEERRAYLLRWCWKLGLNIPQPVEVESGR